MDGSAHSELAMQNILRSRSGTTKVRPEQTLNLFFLWVSSYRHRRSGASACVKASQFTLVASRGTPQAQVVVAHGCHGPRLQAHRDPDGQFYLPFGHSIG